MCSSMRQNFHKTQRERGATLIEFAITFLPFMMLVLASVECAIVGFRSLSIQYVASHGVRKAILRQYTVDQLKKDHIQPLANNLGIPVALSNISICAAKDMRQNGSCKTEGLGEPERFVAVAVVFPTGFMFGIKQFNLIGIAAGRNER